MTPPTAPGQIQDPDEATAAFWDSGQGRFSASAIFRVEPPRELAGLTDAQIERAAAERTG